MMELTSHVRLAAAEVEIVTITGTPETMTTEVVNATTAWTETKITTAGMVTTTVETVPQLWNTPIIWALIQITVPLVQEYKAYSRLPWQLEHLLKCVDISVSCHSTLYTRMTFIYKTLLFYIQKGITNHLYIL